MFARASHGMALGLLALSLRGAWGHRVTPTLLDDGAAASDLEVASETNASAAAGVRCPSYCTTRRDCDLMPSTCSPTRCPQCRKGGGSTGGGSSGGGRRPPAQADQKEVDRLMAELDSLVGLEKVKDQMKELVAQVKFNMERERLGLPDIGGQSLHMSFLGNPGTGKTVVARIVGELMVAMGAIRPTGRKQKSKDEIVVEVSRADLVAEYTGQTAPKVKEAVKKAMGGVLFIDEAYALVQGDKDPFGNEAVDTLIKEMEDHRDKMIVILAGYQTEMQTFLAANPGFKSRVAFHFAFPDYTCSELVRIGELLLQKNNVAIVPEPPRDKSTSVCYPPSGRQAPDSCNWLLSAVKLRTGCCERKDCGKEENRANGNGRTVRNVLEASYRNMASRVLVTFTPAMLEQYNSQYRPSVRGKGKAAQPEPALSCGAGFENIRHGGPYLDLADVGNADVRCAFRLLETSDLEDSLASAIQDQLAANCMALLKPIRVNATEILQSGGILESLDWEKLHDSLFGARECEEAQQMLENKASLVELYGGESDDTNTAELYAGLDGASFAELYANETLATTACKKHMCSSNRDCIQYPHSCGGCRICKKGGTSGPGSTRGPTRPCLPSVCRSRSFCYDSRCQGCSFCMGGTGRTPTPTPPSWGNKCSDLCTSQWWCTSSPDKCSGCSICQGSSGGSSGGSGGGRIVRGNKLKDIECKVCDWAKKNLGHLGRPELERIQDRSTCNKFLQEYGGVSGASYSINEDACMDAVGMVLLFLKVRGTSFDCGDAVGKFCSSDSGHSGGGFKPGGGSAGGGRTPSPTPPAGPVLGPGRPSPISHPGSKVDNLVKELNELIGLEGVKAGINALRDAVEFDMWRKKFLGDEWSLLGQSFHMRFLGNPGTGKTVVARIVGKILVELEVVKKSGKKGKKDKLIFKEVSRADLVAGYVGQTAPKVMEAVKSAFGGVLFIDEAYSLVQDEKDSFGREAVDTLIKEIEDHRDKVIVIFAGYSNEMETFFEANPGFQSRVPFRFEFADYNCEELSKIGMLQLTQQTIEPTATAKEWMSDVVSSKTGCCTKAQMESGDCAGATRDNGNGRAVRNILEGAMRSMSVRAVAATQRGSVTRQLVTALEDVDMAAVAGQLIAESLRGTCKAAGEAVPDLEKLCTGGRILSVSSFSDVLQQSREDCLQTTKLLQGLRSKTSGVDSAMDIDIEDHKISKLFDELDEKVGLLTVKRTMRELFTTVQFAQLRKKVGLEPLKSQSFHMRFLGNPGTGKTVVARIVGKLLVGLGAITKPKSMGSDWMFGGGGGEDEPIFNEVSRADLVAEYVGQTANKTQHWVKESLGGVFFLDEAYALVQGDRDSFGQEAVDTLIKEMEDKRKSVIVICAGYANEMEQFFQSNPGFRSRVPFTFFFEDYTCDELSEIGLLQLKSKQLTLPYDKTAYQQSIRFSTGCCDRLEDCEESKDKGNGRAVRNAVEASIRAMARRLADDTAYPDKSKYSTMVASDFRATTQQMIESRLVVPCGANGEIQKITNSATRAQLGVLEHLPGKREKLAARVQRLAEETRLVAQMAGTLDDTSRRLGEACHARLEDMTAAIRSKLQQVCDPGPTGILEVIQQGLQDESDVDTVQMYANILAGVVRDEAFMREVLHAAWTADERQAEKIPELERNCDERMENLRGVKYQVPFDFVTFGR